MDRLIGKQLGAYQILEELGSGGMASVYRARHTLTNQIVAIKVMHAHLAKDATYVERFRREAGMALALQSPNVVQVIAIGEQDGTWFIVMEYVEGKTLQRVLRERGALPVTEALEITNQILNALEAAFYQGIVHRDIKPQNIMLASDGNVKVMDFGIARAAGSMTLTQTGFFIGTPQYVSPEQAQREHIDIRSDLYSLGIVLYEMLMGIVPFDAETPWVVIRMHLDTKPNPMRRMKRHIPSGVEAIVMRALAKKPEQRFQNPSEMKRAVAEQLRRLQPFPKRVDEIKTIVRPVPKSINARVSPILLIPIAAIILVAAFGAFVLFSTLQNPSRPTFPTSQIALESTATSRPFTALALKPTRLATPTNTRRPSTSTATNVPTPTPTFTQTETPTLVPTPTMLVGDFLIPVDEIKKSLGNEPITFTEQYVTISGQPVKYYDVSFERWGRRATLAGQIPSQVLKAESNSRSIEVRGFTGYYEIKGKRQAVFLLYPESFQGKPVAPVIYLIEGGDPNIYTDWRAGLYDLERGEFVKSDFAMQGLNLDNSNECFSFDIISGQYLDEPSTCSLTYSGFGRNGMRVYDRITSPTMTAIAKIALGVSTNIPRAASRTPSPLAKGTRAPLTPETAAAPADNKDLIGLQGKIAFSRYTGDEDNWDLYSVNANGSNLRRLTQSPGVDSQPSWSPDGSRLAFISNRTGIPLVFFLDVGTSQTVGLSKNEPNILKMWKPSWSPDGGKVISGFSRCGDLSLSATQRSCNSNYSWGLLWIDPSGNEFQDLSRNTTQSFIGDRVDRPLFASDDRLTYGENDSSWAPDSSRIVFSCGGICTVNPDGEDRRQVGGNLGYSYNPAWSPDGSRVAFATTKDGNAEIYVINVDGTGLQNLTNNSADDWWPTWSPDGNKIAFVSMRDQRQQIYIMNADGTNPVNLSNSEYWDDAPAWSK